jgi:hypothetical protein
MKKLCFKYDAEHVLSDKSLRGCGYFSNLHHKKEVVWIAGLPESGQAMIATLSFTSWPYGQRQRARRGHVHCRRADSVLAMSAIMRTADLALWLPDFSF